MAEMLDHVLREIREREEQASAAVEETERLEAALAALTIDACGARCVATS